MSEPALSNSDLLAIHDSASAKTFPDDVRSMAAELLHLRAVVANAVTLINSGRCGLGHDVLITRKLNHER